METITDMVIQICKTSDEDEEVLHYLFDVFSKQQPYMKKQALADFIEIFNVPRGVFATNAKMSLDTFLTALEKTRLSFEPLRQAKPMITAMVALRTESVKEEKAAILAALNGNKHLENYIYDALLREKEFFVVNRAFWDGWCQAVDWLQDTEFGLKVDRQLQIKNAELMEPNH